MNHLGSVSKKCRELIESGKYQLFQIHANKVLVNGKTVSALVEIPDIFFTARRGFTVYKKFTFKKKSNVMMADRIEFAGQSFIAESCVQNASGTFTVTASRPMTAKEKRDPFNIQEAFMIESGMFASSDGVINTSYGYAPCGTGALKIKPPRRQA